MRPRSARSPFASCGQDLKTVAVAGHEGAAVALDVRQRPEPVHLGSKIQSG